MESVYIQLSDDWYAWFCGPGSHMSCTDLHHGGNGMDSVEVLHETLGQVGHTQPDGPVSVAFQADHLIGAAGNTVVELLYGYVHF